MKITIKKNTKQEKTMIKFLKESCNELHIISDSRTKSTIDMYKYGNSFFYATDWKDKILAYYNFFITMIGFTEAYIIDTSKKIKFEQNKKTLNELIEQLELLIKDRQDIVNTYLNNEPDNDLEIVKEMLKMPFLFNELHNIYKDLEDDNDKYQLHKAFVQAYNQGSMLADNCDYKKVRLIYNDLWLSYSQNKNNNERKLYEIDHAKQFSKIIRHKNEKSKSCD